MASPTAVVSRACQIPPERSAGSTRAPPLLQLPKRLDHAEYGPQQTEQGAHVADHHQPLRGLLRQPLHQAPAAAGGAGPGETLTRQPVLGDGIDGGEPQAALQGVVGHEPRRQGRQRPARPVRVQVRKPAPVPGHLADRGQRGTQGAPAGPVADQNPGDGCAQAQVQDLQGPVGQVRSAGPG